MNRPEKALKAKAALKAYLEANPEAAKHGLRTLSQAIKTQAGYAPSSGAIATWKKDLGYKPNPRGFKGRRRPAESAREVRAGGSASRAQPNVSAPDNASNDDSFMTPWGVSRATMRTALAGPIKALKEVAVEHNLSKVQLVLVDGKVEAILQRMAFDKFSV